MSRNAELAGFTRVKDRIPRNGKGADNLLEQLSTFLHDPENKYLQKMVVEANRPYIYIEKFLPKDIAPPPVLTLHDVLRQVPMEEQVLVSTGSVLDMFHRITKNEFETCMVAVGTNTKLYEWLEIPRRFDRMYGLPIEKIPELPNDVIILCGARSRDGGVEDIEFAVKGSIP